MAANTVTIKIDTVEKEIWDAILALVNNANTLGQLANASESIQALAEKSEEILALLGDSEENTET